MDFVEGLSKSEGFDTSSFLICYFQVDIFIFDMLFPGLVGQYLLFLVVVVNIDSFPI